MGSVILVPRQTGTQADVFTAAGLASLLATSGHGDVRLTEETTAFSVEGPDLQTTWPLVAIHPGYDYLKPKTGAAVPVGVVDVLDYQQEREREERHRKTQDVVRAARMRDTPVDPVLLQEAEVNRPRSDWRLYKVLLALQGHMNANKVHEVLAGMADEDARARLRQALSAFAAGESSGMKWPVSAVQLFNPAAAKGYARLKPDGTDRNDKTKEGWTDPFVEWLRYRGYFATACPYFLGKKGEHIRLITPIPADISVRALTAVVDELRRMGLRASAPKVDALAVLRLVRILIEHSAEYAERAPAGPTVFTLLLRGRTPASVISGVTVTHYQSLGQARAVSELLTLALPAWFPIYTGEDAALWLAILDEHRRVVSSLRDDRSDEIGILLGYRRFLERRGAAATHQFIDVVGAYGAFLLPAREQRRRLPSFRTDYFLRVVKGMMEPYVAILDDPGFRSVAAAVRRATVSAQAQKAMGQQNYREIRYELLHEIRRKRLLPGAAPLLETVAEFVASYNYENARRREQGQPAPRNVTTEEFRTFTAQVERHGAALVGALLAAYGSCREPHEEPEPAIGLATGSSEDVADDENVVASEEE